MPRPLLLPLAAGLLLVAACGGDDDASSAAADPTRTIEVEMVDIAYAPERIEVEAGETVRFVFTNAGEVPHDAFIGDAEAQADHGAEMREAEGDGDGDSDGHGGHGDDAEDAVTVEPGEQAELTHTFGEPGTLEIGCHQPGHYDAGMKLTVEVA